jgi:hypothetical protein
MRDKKNTLIVVVASIFLIGLVVVSLMSGREKNAKDLVAQTVVVEGSVVTDSEMPTSEPLTTEVQDSPDPSLAVELEEIAVPTPRAGLESTNPASVNLESGGIQLVEAFAFW